MTVIFLLMLLAADITDLGVMTEHRLIALEPCTNRADFVMFHIELKALRWPSNYFSFTTTNRTLSMESFMAMPPGPCAMGVKSICADNEESPMALFKQDIRRDPPKAPTAHLVYKAEPQPSQTLSNAFRTRTMIALPPTPGSAATNQFPGPLPNGRPETYSDSVIRMQEFYAQHQGRRNQ